MSCKNKSASTKEMESQIVVKNLPNFLKLLKSTKIGEAEKLQVFEDVNYDLAAFLESIDEEI